MSIVNIIKFYSISKVESNGLDCETNESDTSHSASVCYLMFKNFRSYISHNFHRYYKGVKVDYGELGSLAVAGYGAVNHMWLKSTGGVSAHNRTAVCRSNYNN